MSHEIRTPLNAIIGYGQLLKEEAEDVEDRLMLADVERILDAAHYLVRLINMILDLSKIEAGRMRFDAQPHRLEALIGKAVAARAPLLAERDIVVSVEIEPGLDTVEVDAHRFLQVVDSILENAALHTSAGEVTVRASGAGSNGRRVFRVAIADTGEGIPPEALPTLFETFAIGEGAADGRYGGTGLNLTVCSRLTRAMGGSIAVESTRGEGATFTVTLPMAPAERGAVPEPRRASA
jgi:signal transduction histidine kinase